MTKLASLTILIAIAACSVSEPNERGQVGEPREDAGRQDASPPKTTRDGGRSSPIGETCAEANIVATRRPLTVWFALDDSLDLNQDSTQEQLGPAWGFIRETLLGEQGVVTQLEDAVRFGWIAVGIPMDGYCEQPKMTFVDPALHNRAAIEAKYEPMGDRSQNVSAPYYSFKHALENTRATPAAERGKTVMIVARGPNLEYICHVDVLANLNLGDAPDPSFGGMRLSNQAIADLVADGVSVYAFAAVKGVGNSPVDRAQEIAELGKTGRGPVEWRSPDDLRTELLSLAGELIGCEFELNGSVEPGEECYGSVTIDGRVLPCNNSDGWRMKDSRTVELTGTECANLKQKPAARFVANFPCEAWVPLI